VTLLATEPSPAQRQGVTSANSTNSEEHSAASAALASTTGVLLRFARNTWASAAQPKQVRALDSGKTPVKPACRVTSVLPALESCKYLSHQSSCKYLVPSSCKYLALSRTGKADQETRRQGDRETGKRQQLFLCVPSCLRVFVVRIPESAVPGRAVGRSPRPR
jgi:hypothetical protein